ncbi:MAG: hypothetical protein IJ438_07450 [Clostridia bacterium]|nr:hypothetical protein [Clostridia bacterium]
MSVETAFVAGARPSIPKIAGTPGRQLKELGADGTLSRKEIPHLGK